MADNLLQLCKSHLPVIEQALETAALMLGSGQSRGHCLEMICPNFFRGPTSRTNTRTL